MNPTTGSASAEAVLGVSGTDCPRSARFWITEDGDEKEGAQFADSDAEGTWRGQLNIDEEDSPARSYEVAAECFDRPGVVTFKYQPRPITVLP